MPHQWFGSEKEMEVAVNELDVERQLKQKQNEKDLSAANRYDETSPGHRSARCAGSHDPAPYRGQRSRSKNGQKLQKLVLGIWTYQLRL